MAFLLMCVLRLSVARKSSVDSEVEKYRCILSTICYIS